MSEKKTYNYDFECWNCRRTNQWKIPFGIPASKFITKSKLVSCIHCGCNPLSLIQREMK